MCPPARGALHPQCDGAHTLFAGVICPNLRVKDCYFDDSVCGENEYCMLIDQVGRV